MADRLDARGRPGSSRGPPALAHAMLGAPSYPWSNQEVVVNVEVSGAWFDEFDENAAAVLGVDEVHPGVCRTASGCVVDQAHALLAQLFRKGIEITDPNGHLLDARTALVEELRDRGGLVDRGHQLDLRGARRGAAHSQHGCADSLLLVDF